MDPPTTAPPEEMDRPRLGPRVRVAMLGGAASVAAVVLLLLVQDPSTMGLQHPFITLAVTIGFALSERLIFHVEARNEAHSYTPSEIALASGLLFLHPIELIAARLIGAAVGMALWRRVPLFKLAFNLANFALETALSVAIFGVLVDDDAGILVSWVGLLTALSVALVFGSLVVATVIAQFEGELVRRVRRELLNAPIFAIPSVVLASSIALPMAIDPRLGIVALLPAPVYWLLLRSYGQLMHRFIDLSSVHDFSRDIGDAGDLHTIATTAAERVSQHTRAQRVALRLWQSDGKPVDGLIGPPVDLGALPSRPDQSAWEPILLAREARRFDETGPRIRSALLDAGFGDGLVAPITDEQGTLGVVIIANRSGPQPRFDDDDVSRLTAMTQQLAVAVRKVQFHSQIQFEATHDRLTALPNRSYFENWIDQASATGRHGAVLLIDLDRFKQINDAFGHHCGDILLIEAARRIRAVCGIAEVASRFGGDEFAIYAPDIDQPTAEQLAEEVSVALEQTFDIGPANVAIAASIGIALSPLHARDAANLLRRADIAMYDAKTRRVRSSVYRDELDENDSERLTLLNDLRLALRDGTIDVHYQPQLALDTGRVCGAEALARWEHPDRGRIPPDVFVELAEQAGLIEELTSQVMAKATIAASDWNRRGLDLTISVNISAQSLLDKKLEPLVAQAVQTSGLEPEKLVLEITESTMMSDTPMTHRVLHRLSKLGIGLSVDDFGTGFSSLVNLRNLPVNELKIDRSFVADMMNKHDDDVIVRSTIDLAHNLGLVVVAEGVETPEILQRLADLGCDVAQGYGICRPIPLDQFETWIEERRRSTTPTKPSIGRSAASHQR